jgi:uncharacterized protein YlxP (DUF503 family)
MVVGIGIVDIYIFDSRSLKSKRGVLRSILKRTQNQFNISIAEVGNNDNWKRSRIGFSVVGNNRSYINSKIDEILRFIDNLNLAEVLNSEVEIISLSGLVQQDDYIKDVTVNDHDEL